MKTLIFILTLLCSFASVAVPNSFNFQRDYVSHIQDVTDADESINFQPGLNLYNESQLTDLFGTNGNQLCAPISVTHAFSFLKYYRNPNFSTLMDMPDMDYDGVANSYKDQIRYFFNVCNTDKEEGTRIWSFVDCMRSYITSSKMTPWAYIIGAHPKDAPAGYDISQVRRSVTTVDVRTYAQAQLGIIMSIGWYVYNTQTKTYERKGGHYFNVYGYDYNNSWGENKIVLKVVNNWINYTGRDRSRMYDNVELSKFYGGPENVTWEANGPGFTTTGYKALVENILVFLPL